MRVLLLFVLLSTSATALTIDASWTLVQDCADAVVVDAPNSLAVGERATIVFDAYAIEQFNYTIVDDDGTRVRDWRVVKHKASFTPSKKNAGRSVVVSVQGVGECMPVGNATITIEGERAVKAAGGGFRTMSVVPWLLVALSSIIAAVLVWRR